MTLDSGVGALAQRIAAEFNAVRDEVDDAVADKIGSSNASVTNIEYYASVAALPVTGVVGTIYFVNA